MEKGRRQVHYDGSNLAYRDRGRGNPIPIPIEFLGLSGLPSERANEYIININIMMENNVCLQLKCMSLSAIQIEIQVWDE